MKLDNFTYQDLYIFSSNEENSVFQKLDFTITHGGREKLYQIFCHPHRSTEKIIETQNIIRKVKEKLHVFQNGITNGTIVVIEKFLDYQLEPMPGAGNAISALLYRMLNPSDFSMAKFSLVHFHEFVLGLHHIHQNLRETDLPKQLQTKIDRIEKLLSCHQINEILQKKKGSLFTIRETIFFSKFFFVEFKKQIEELIEIFSQFDAWQSMAKSMDTYQLQFPEFIESDAPILDAQGIHHLLLPNAIAYNVSMNPKNNFIFLTGANMAGKSTFIKAIGLACFLAHLGIGVPANNMKLSFFEGILTNITVTDNIVKGESYFFNEVKRIRETILKINDGKKWLVLIDELFKGTNIQDAMKCSITVIQGLIKLKQALFILSTHLYEIAEKLKVHENISFKYFETSIENNQLIFNYNLKDGISNDRIGYLILKKEGVVELLESI